MKVIAVLCVGLTLVAVATCYGTGAPSQACAKLAPMHTGTTPQATPSPYKITVKAADGGDLKWAPGSSLNVTISGGTINGFILQGLMKAGNGVGSFDKDKMPAKTQRAPCTATDGTTPMSVTHTSPEDKSDLMFVWTAPASGVTPGAMYFKGAVATSHDTYWVDLKSADIPGEASNNTSTTISPNTTPSTTIINANTTTASNMTTNSPKSTTAGSASRSAPAMVVYLVLACVVKTLF